MPRLTDEQLADRAKGLGATDIATAAGVNPYGTAFELYLEKIGELDPDETIDDAARGRMERGHRLEDVALEWDRDHQAELTGIVEPYQRVSRTIWHRTLPFIYAHPDARRTPWTKTRRLIEVKTAARRWKEVPRVVEAQVQVQMAVTGATSVDVVVLSFDGPPTRWLVQRDDQLIDALERVATAFWDRVQRREPPPLDGSAGASRWLDRTRWGSEPDARADAGQTSLVARILEVRAAKAQLDAEEDALINQLKFTMPGAGRLWAPGVGRVNWTAPYEVKTTKWKEVAGTFKTELAMFAAAGQTSTDVEAVVAQYTSVKETRQFRVEADEREDETNAHA